MNVQTFDGTLDFQYFGARAKGCGGGQNRARLGIDLPAELKAGWTTEGDLQAYAKRMTEGF